MSITAITGGIGSGKSIVAEILRTMGYAVYDCDLEAKRIMDADKAIHDALCREIHPRAVCYGRVDRPLISSIVFGDAAALGRLNAIVHEAVRRHLADWIARTPGDKFVETAIPRSSRLVEMVDREWHVTAPVEVRVGRVMRRSGLSPEQIRARIASQNCEAPGPDDKVDYIDNSPRRALLPRVVGLLQKEGTIRAGDVLVET